MEVFIESELKELIPEYLEGLQESITLLKNCSSDENWNEIHREGHKLKGHGKAFGFDYVSTLGAKLEDAADEKNKQEIEKLINSFVDYTENLDIKFK